jgi:hypothetical protein
MITVPLTAQPPAATDIHVDSLRVGFDQTWKLGCWTPVAIELAGGEPGAAVAVELVAPDDDGVDTVVRTSPASPVRFDDAGRAVCRSFTKIGRADATLRVRVLVDEHLVASRNFIASDAAGANDIRAGRPANTRLLVQIGNADVGLAEAFREQNTQPDGPSRQVVEVGSFDELPTAWYGYDAVDQIVIPASDPQFFASLAGDDPRLAALAEWVEMGGRLLVMCGRHAESLLVAGRPLADLVPGEFAEIVTLDNARAIEQYSQSEEAVRTERGRLEFSVPRVVNVAGRIEAFEGPAATDLPLVIRAPRGFGELVFAALDLNEPPLVDWPGRQKLLQQLLDLDESPTASRPASSRRLTTRGYDDLAGALRDRLGSQFANVRGVPFGLVAVLALGYLALVGPIDYYLVRRVFRRMQWTWFTFPAIVLLVCWGAYGFASARKGTVSRINQVELVDIDLASGRARGSTWATLYSPRATTYDLALAPRWPGGGAVANPSVQLSWFGMPGMGLRGMSSSGGLPTATDIEYRYGSELDRLENLPVETWSTKTLAARWTAPAAEMVVAELTATVENLVEGTVRNASGVRLDDARLLFGTWGWRLGDIAAGESVTIDRRLDPLKIRTLLTGVNRGAADGPRPGGPFVAEEADIDELLDLMMFYQASGGRGFSRLGNEHQSFCDLSHQLDLGRAVLLARCDQPGSELQRDGEAIHTELDGRWTVVRFVIPVQLE